MKGAIYSDQRCVVCNAKMRDTGRDVSCSVHPQVKATRFRVKFGTVVKRFKNYGEAFRFLTGVRYETDRKTFDARDYRRDNPLSFSNASQRYGDHRKPDIRPTSYRSMGNHFEKARRYFGDRNIKDLKYADFEDFLKTLTVGGKTKKNIMTSICVLLIMACGTVSAKECKECPQDRPCAYYVPAADSCNTCVGTTWCIDDKWYSNRQKLCTSMHCIKTFEIQNPFTDEQKRFTVQPE